MAAVVVIVLVVVSSLLVAVDLTAIANNQHSQYDNKVDVCESSIEIVTPYWASNAAGKIRGIVNNQHWQQAIQQEVCKSNQTKRCHSDCSCEQKYKWHRLLAYDPDDDCKGIFMDWFLFPSCCACRCLNPIIVHSDSPLPSPSSSSY